MNIMINRVAVIGAGTMGAAIAAHLANIGLPVDLLDIAPQEEKKGGRNRIVNEGWQRCLKARPAALFTPAFAQRVRLGNLKDDFERLSEADWIIEVIVERLDIKKQLVARIDQVRKPGSIVSTNTSGIPIKEIAHGCSEDFQAHFLGTHFFNPPRYLRLLEIIPHEKTAPEIIEFMREFGSKTLGKGVVICKDTPNFIANRFLSIVGSYTINYALDNDYTVAEVDSLTGPLIGHPKTATFRLLDLIGVDVMTHINTNLYPAIVGDPHRKELSHEKSTALAAAMLERKWLGNKTRQGFYKQVRTKEGRQFWTLDPETLEYLPPTRPRFEAVDKHRQVADTGERIKRLCAENDRAAQLIWAVTAFSLNYAAYLVPSAADDICAIDQANKWGFNHQLGPFEIWDALGVGAAVARMEAEGMTVTPWVKKMLAAGHDSFYKQKKEGRYIYDPVTEGYIALPDDPHAITLPNIKQDKKRIVGGNPSASLVDLGEGVLGLEFHSKKNSLDEEIIALMLEARKELDKGWQGLVIGNQGENFCVGANLAIIAAASQQGEWTRLEKSIKTLQDALMAFRYSPKPVVSTPFGLTLGGGAEVTLCAAAVCAGAETYLGLTEVGVGLVPSGGGCKELVRRILSPVAASTPAALLQPFLQRVFDLIGMARVSGSAEEARQWGFLATSDRVVMNPAHLLREAKRTVLYLAASGYHPPVYGKNIWALGANGAAAIESLVWSYKEAGYASAHDALIANKLAHILCGGKLSRPQWVEPQYILDLEREAFLSLLGEQKTQERIAFMLKRGKPLRN